MSIPFFHLSAKAQKTNTGLYKVMLSLSKMLSTGECIPSFASCLHVPEYEATCFTFNKHCYVFWPNIFRRRHFKNSRMWRLCPSKISSRRSTKLKLRFISCVYLMDLQPICVNSCLCNRCFLFVLFYFL